MSFWRLGRQDMRDQVFRDHFLLDLALVNSQWYDYLSDKGP